MKPLLVLISISLLVVVLLATTAYIPLSVQAQSPVSDNPVSDDEVNAIAKGLYCPICENTPLDVCPTQACKDWRELIRQQLSEDWTEDEIKDYFVANYGPRVLAQPPAQGFTVLVWILPGVALAGGGIWLWRLLRSWQQHPSPVKPVVADVTTDAPDIDPEMLARIEREIETRF